MPGEKDGECRAQRGHGLVHRQPGALGEEKRSVIRRKRLDRVCELVPQPEQLAAGNEDVEVGTLRDELPDRRGAFDDLLEVDTREPATAGARS